MLGKCWECQLLGKYVGNHIKCGYLYKLDITSCHSFSKEKVSDGNVFDAWLLLARQGNIDTCLIVLIDSCRFPLSVSQFL